MRRPQNCPPGAGQRMARGLQDPALHHAAAGEGMARGATVQSPRCALAALRGPAGWNDDWLTSDDDTRREAGRSVPQWACAAYAMRTPTSTHAGCAERSQGGVCSNDRIARIHVLLRLRPLLLLTMLCGRGGGGCGPLLGFSAGVWGTWLKAGTSSLLLLVAGPGPRTPLQPTPLSPVPRPHPLPKQAALFLAPSPSPRGTMAASMARLPSVCSCSPRCQRAPTAALAGACRTPVLRVQPSTSGRQVRGWCPPRQHTRLRRRALPASPASQRQHPVRAVKPIAGGPGHRGDPWREQPWLLMRTACMIALHTCTRRP